MGVHRHVSLRWGMSVTDGASWSPMGLRWYSNLACRSPTKHVKVSDGSPIRHVGLQCSISRSPMGLWSGMSVSEEACQGLQWVSNQACRSPMKHVKVSKRVSYQACWSPKGLWKVTDGSLIIIIFFMNSKWNIKIAFLILNFNINYINWEFGVFVKHYFKSVCIFALFWDFFLATELWTLTKMFCS